MNGVSGLIEYDAASVEVRAVYDDIMATRQVDLVNNFWKMLANHRPTLQQVWAEVKAAMGPGALDPLTKEMIYVVVSATESHFYNHQRPHQALGYQTPADLFPHQPSRSLSGGLSPHPRICRSFLPEWMFFAALLCPASAVQSNSLIGG